MCEQERASKLQNDETVKLQTELSLWERKLERERKQTEKFKVVHFEVQYTAAKTTHCQHTVNTLLFYRTLCETLLCRCRVKLLALARHACDSTSIHGTCKIVF
jgi:uncharacterized protein (DUF2344 family)